MHKTYRVDPDNPSDEVINHAAAVLIDGGTVVFPTETVYGIGAKADSVFGCQELFDIKIRDRSKPIPWLVEDASALDTYGLDVPEYAYKLAEKYWPGALTLVVKASDAVGKDFRAPDGTIALRSPNSTIPLRLIKLVGAPLITSSANTHGLPAPASFEEIEPRIVAAADMVLDAGETVHGKASTVVVCTGPEPVIWRDEAIPAAEILALLAE